MALEIPRRSDPRVEIDWQGDGSWDDVTRHVRVPPSPSGREITVERGRDKERVLGGPMATRFDFTLSNESRRYASEFSGSDIHGLVRGGKPCRVRDRIGVDVAMDDPTATMDDPVVFMGGRETVPVATGRLLEPDEGYGFGNRVVGIAVLGMLSRLTKIRVTVPLQQMITTGAAAVLVFEAAGFVEGIDYAVDPEAIVNGRVLPFWWVDDRVAHEVLTELWLTEGPPATYTEDMRGRAVFLGRFWRTLSERSLHVQAIFADTIISRDVARMDDPTVRMDDPIVTMEGEARALYHAAIRATPGRDTVVNRAAIQVDLRAVQPLQQVWQADGPLVLGANESRDLIVRPQGGDPLTNVQVPAAGTDYVLGAGTLASVTVAALGPLAVRITLVAGAGGATVNPAGSNSGLQLRAAPVAVVSTVVAENSVADSASEAEFGDQPLPDSLAIWRCLLYEEAVALADAYVLGYSQPRPTVWVTVENGTGELLAAIARLEVGDRVHTIDAWSGLDHDVTVERIRETFGPGGRRVAELACEHVVEQDWARWDVGRWDVDRWGN